MIASTGAMAMSEIKAAAIDQARHAMRRRMGL